MKLQYFNKSFKINRKLYDKCTDFVLNQEIIVPDVKPDILEVLHKNGYVCIDRAQVVDGKIRLNGICDIELIYMADNEQNDIRGLSTQIEINECIDVSNICLSANIFTKPMICSIECKVINERKVLVSVCIRTRIILENNEDVQYIDNISEDKNVQVLKDEFDVSTLNGYEMQNISLNEEITIDNNEIVELLENNIIVTNQESKVSYNKILVKSDVVINMIFATDKNQLYTKQAILPLTGFIDMQGVDENSILEINYSVLNKSVKLNDTMENKKIAINMEVMVLVKNYVNNKINVISDIYGLNRDIRFDNTSIQTEKIASFKNLDHCINQNVVLDDVSNDIYSVNVSVKDYDIKKVNDKLHIDGEMKIDVICRNSNKITTKVFEVPFNHAYDDPNILNSNAYDVDINIQNINYKVNDCKLDINVYMCFKIKLKNINSVNSISNIIEEELKPINNPSITVYYVKPNDSFWSIAKKFAVAMEDIASYNELDLNTYILRPGMQLFIPKNNIRKVV